MTDRVPGAPGQYKATVTEEELQKMQSGVEFTITMTRDDQPIVEGTPYSKAAVLPDALAAQLCPEVDDPTPADALQAIHSRIYPVGSIYLSVLDTDPKDLFGGTWEQMKDRFLLAAGDSYPAGTAGGEATHKLTLEEVPTHNHSFHTTNTGATDRSVGAAYRDTFWTSEDYILNETTYAGGGQAHNNMPPYLAVYMWKRIA